MLHPTHELRWNKLWIKTKYTKRHNRSTRPPNEIKITPAAFTTENKTAAAEKYAPNKHVAHNWQQRLPKYVIKHKYEKSR